MLASFDGGLSTVFGTETLAEEQRTEVHQLVLWRSAGECCGVTSPLSIVDSRLGDFVRLLELQEDREGVGGAVVPKMRFAVRLSLSGQPAPKGP